MPQSLAAMYAHIIFSTKHRAPLITPAVQSRLYAYIGGIIRGETGCLLAIGGMPDHLHLLVSMGRTVSLADLVRDVKSNSSRFVHETLAEPSFAWQSGYGAFSVSFSLTPAVRHYIETQAEHHAKLSFQDEYRKALELHGVEWDERYVWD